MPDPTARDCLRLLAEAAAQSMPIARLDNFNVAVRTLEAVLADAEARAAIAADIAKQSEKPAA